MPEESESGAEMPAGQKLPDPEHLISHGNRSAGREQVLSDASGAR
jgi:hypothetical protein